MAVPRTMQIQEISAHPGTVPGKGTQRAGSPPNPASVGIAPRLAG